ncbi:hypothetical protein N9X61_04375 [Sulfurimonas sp.]|nr:hypothetical protein [Sulfurimonas sp.]
MANYRELDNKVHNSMYYNQILREAENKKVRKVSKQNDFGSKEVDFSKYLIVPNGYEGIGYTLYFILLPYIVGITFLFFYVARAAYTNFALLDLSSFLIVWAIGYEITGAIILFFIFLAFLKHLKRQAK